MTLKSQQWHRRSKSRLMAIRFRIEFLLTDLGNPGVAAGTDTGTGAGPDMGMNLSGCETGEVDKLFLSASFFVFGKKEAGPGENKPCGSIERRTQPDRMR